VDDPGKPGEDTEFYYASWCTKHKDWAGFALNFFEYEDTEFYYASWCTKHKDWAGFALNFFEYCWQKADDDLDAMATTIHELTHLDNELTY